MQADYWHQKWKKNDIAFHEGNVNSHLARYFKTLAVPAGGTILVPLCGKTFDMFWLKQQGFNVVGIELSELAVKAFFTEAELAYEVIPLGNATLYQAEGIKIYVADFFTVTRDMVGAVDAVYDRAALVALPDDMRKHYASHLVRLSSAAPQLLLTFSYDQQQMPGPPFAVKEATVSALYSDSHTIELLQKSPMDDKLKGQIDAIDLIWLLT